MLNTPQINNLELYTFCLLSRPETKWANKMLKITIYPANGNPGTYIRW